MSRTRLPDPDAARLELSEAVSELGLPIAKQTRAQADAVSLLLERGRLRRSTREAADLIYAIGAAPHDSYDSWSRTVESILEGFFSLGDRWNSVGIRRALQISATAP